jgi:hypothetical protein
MSEVDETRTTAADATVHAAAELEHQTVPASGPQPLRPTTPLHALPRTQLPIRRPEPEPRPRFGRTMNAIKTVLPILQRALPLLEGNVAMTVANLLAPMPFGGSTNLEPVERAIRSVHAEIEQIRSSHDEQSAILKRVDEQLSDLRDVADRLSARQLELTDEIHSLRRRLVVVAVLGLLLLTASLGVSIFLLLKTGAISR